MAMNDALPYLPLYIRTMNSHCTLAAGSITSFLVALLKMVRHDLCTCTMTSRCTLQASSVTFILVAMLRLGARNPVSLPKLLLWVLIVVSVMLSAKPLLWSRLCGVWYAQCHASALGFTSVMHIASLTWILTCRPRVYDFYEGWI
jgi:hypothetical protein